MSVLVQRPHQISGLMTLQRQHPKPSPRHKPQPTSSTPRNTLPTVSPPVLSPTVPRRQRAPHSPSPANHPNPRSSKRRNPTTANTSGSPTLDAAPGFQSISSSLSSGLPTSTVSASLHASPATTLPAPPQLPPATPPRRSTRPAHSAPTTPAPANSLPVPANRRRARSPRPTSKLPPAFPIDEDAALTSDDPTVSPSQRTRRAPGSIALPHDSPTNWQQAALLNKAVHPSGPASTPTSPARPVPSTTTTLFSGLAHSPTMPNFPVHNANAHARRAGGHARAPSFPTFPSTTSMNMNTNLDALFSSALVLSTPHGKSTHVRGASVSSSLPPQSVLHKAARERTLTGGTTFPTTNSGKFAGADFQRAPDAMVLPKPSFLGGRFGMFSTGVSSSSEESSEGESGEEVVDLGEDGESEDEVVFALP